ncbi:aladin [Klebsormidium nitens]|uniref:Aladin n=1 Tax=Klebsormidium nitens TaxID=105231 RepID=A0A1Y1I3E7_KLENI|nr:aladin [Klebsormidium nitens]|eukprot:GAQ83277.1 aladin [Klebsormidium nitens]
MARSIPDVEEATVCEVNRGLVHVRRGDAQALQDVQNSIQAYLYPTLTIDLKDPTDLLVDTVPILSYWGATKEAPAAKSLPAPGGPPSETSPKDTPSSSHAATSQTGSPSQEGVQNSTQPKLALQQLQTLVLTLVARARSALGPLISGPPPTLLETGPLRDLSWHSAKQRLAVIGPFDRILLYDLEARGEAAATPGVLAHEFQKGAAMVRWRPKAAGGLAVACRTGVCFWTLTPPVHICPLSPSPAVRGSPSVRHRKPLQATMVFFQSPSGAPFTAVEWSPDGRLLAASSSLDSSIMVYDVATGAGAPLRRGLGGEALLRWAPSGDYFFSAKMNGNFHLWETTRWTSEPWASQSGRVVAAAWSPDSRALLLAFENSTTLGAIHLTGKVPSLDAHLIPLELPEVEALASRACPNPGIEHMAWDAGGDRLAVSYRGGDEQTGGLVAVYDTRRTPVVAASFIGLIRGPKADSRPLSLSFFNRFARGSLLAVAWSSSQISVYPLLYKGR